MDNVDDILLLSLSLYLYNNNINENQEITRKKVRKKRRWWVRPINQERKKYGEFRRLFLELKLLDKEWFFTYTRMTSQRYDHLLTLIGPKLIKRSNRGVLPPSQRLAMTLRYLATGDGTFSIASSYRVGRSTVSSVVRETMSVLWEVLSEIYLPEPSEEALLHTSEEFWSRWNVPNCCGAIDGKHIRIEAPPNSGTLYFNYKKFFSVVLLAVCDAKYNFLYVDIGAYGSLSDGAVFSDSVIGQLINSGKINFPPKRLLPGSQQYKLKFFLLGDAAFPLKEQLMRPYPGHNLDIMKAVFNYRHSRGRRTIENAFGILQARWKIFSRSISASVETVMLIIKSTVCLHNFLKKEEETLPHNEKVYCTPSFADSPDDVLGEWRSEVTSSIMHSFTRLGSNNSTARAQMHRDLLAHFFLTPAGFKKGQIEYVKRTH